MIHHADSIPIDSFLRPDGIHILCKAEKNSEGSIALDSDLPCWYRRFMLFDHH